jgi:hypothetical protein
VKVLLADQEAAGKIIGELTAFFLYLSFDFNWTQKKTFSNIMTLRPLNFASRNFLLLKKLGRTLLFLRQTLGDEL